MSYHWHWAILFEPSPEGVGTYLDVLLTGLGWTIITAIFAWLVAFTVGSAIGILRTLPWAFGNRVGLVYVEVFRGIPLIVQLFLWFFVAPEILPRAWGDWVKQLQYGPFYVAILGIGLFMAARVAEQVRAGVQALADGQLKAALAVGLTLGQSYRYVLMPLAYRIMLPTLTSEVLNTIKNTSVALTIGLLELTARARAMQEQSFQVFEAFTVATVLYLLLNLAVVFVSRLIERRLVRSETFLATR